ncbi:uncharacterized protein A1O9_02126 [Exophiala aquamarina CBS 119918]|uniref:Adenosinetriphosphatase n=1 Tax=Exophiala aquamarina CBS 119918 TaxID=1182545 RepID=A0A072PY68_9EURO|nr:uncharacterized protein A1O9_02126 [Exophiala aquamarina CBS 119918]KEF60565.1 hypothetical protein A1O9_02126 [Exophiala aquamarina CBS 119918]
MYKTKAKRKIETVDLTGSDDDDCVYNIPAANPPRKLPSSFSSSRVQKNVVIPPNRSQEPGQYSSAIPSSSQRHRNELPTPPSSSQTYGGYSMPIHLDGTHSQAERQSWLASTQEQDADIAREVDLTEDFDDDVYENFQLYGILNTKIVGCRFYGGKATVGEYVKVRREPSNPYDSNAIRIDNVQRDQIGHIGRNVAAKLAPLMDAGSLLVEGALTGHKEYYECPIGLKLFGTSDPVAGAALRQQMQNLRLPINEFTRQEREAKKRAQELEKQKKSREKVAAAMHKKGNTVFDNEGNGGWSNLSQIVGMSLPQAPGMDQLLEGTSTFNPRDVESLVNKLGAGEDVLAKLPMADQPELLATTLLPYQRQGLHWMLDHESPKLPEADDVVQLWKKVGNVYTNIATNFSITKAPQLARGGLLADDMGLGKTIQIISLIMADPNKDGSPTLIICPMSVMSNWKHQAALHVRKQYAPRVFVYHGGANRNLRPKELKEYDIVITTYQTMTQELFPYGISEPRRTPSKDGLFSITWRRIVLDEGHQIRNPKAKMSQAACTLQAQSRWILTGTPIVNSLKDLFSHIKFLRLSGGVAEFEIFNSTLIRRLKNGENGARMLLQALMSALCLRRMKDMRLVDIKLPEITFHKYAIQFLPHEQEQYDAFKAEAKGMVEAVKAQKGDNTITHLLEVLLRLRQTCNHWKMCGEERVKKLLALVEDNKVVDVMNPGNRKTLQDLLQVRIDSQEECPICLETLKDPMITACAHSFCRDCISRVINAQHRCPLCRADLNTDALVEPSAGMGENEEIDLNIDPDTTSSKIEALVTVLQASEADPTVKTVVFSQWTSFLDLVQTQLTKNGLNFTRLDGKMKPASRDAAIESLNADDSCKIMIASLSVCSVGLNLVAANQVILADSWWAPAIEDQAVDRVHRLGQTRRCKVVRLVVEGTIEDEVLEIQAKKRQLASEAFGEKDGARKRKEQRAGTLRDIERLLG